MRVVRVCPSVGIELNFNGSEHFVEYRPSDAAHNGVEWFTPETILREYVVIFDALDQKKFISTLVAPLKSALLNRQHRE